MDELPNILEQHYYANKILISDWNHFDTIVRATIVVHLKSGRLDRWMNIENEWKLVSEDEQRLSEDDVRPDKMTIVTFHYGKSFNDSNPRIIYLGTWEKDGKVLVCGINLNYLDDAQEKTVKDNMVFVLAEANTQRRVSTLRSFINDDEIFDAAYRTYDERYVHVMGVDEEGIVSLFSMD